MLLKNVLKIVKITLEISFELLIDSLRNYVI